MVPKECYNLLLFISLLLSVTCFIYFDEVASIIPSRYTIFNQLDDSIVRNVMVRNILKNESVLNSKSKHIWQEIPDTFDTKCLLSNTNISWDSFPEENLDFLATEEGKKYKKILSYHWGYVPHLYFGLGRKPFEEACCKEKRCFMTARRDVIPVTDFDALIFQHYNLYEHNVPKNRSVNQRWVFFEKEPPTISFGNTKFFNGLFNWTMTYRRDSDIFAGYGFVFPKSIFSLPKNESEAEIHSALQQQFRNKTKIAAWFVSHCKTESLREAYVSELQNHMEVDVYGKCGPLKCSYANRTFCYEMLEKDYKFYLSFENSLCKDYVTEKFFNIMKLNVIPVVFGSADYDYVAPPHSFINARNFTTIKELANYLIYLSNNETAYLEYFRWKIDFFISSPQWITNGVGFCGLCKKLHEDSPKKVYFDIKKWYIRKSDCVNLYPHK